MMTRWLTFLELELTLMILFHEMTILKILTKRKLRKRRANFPIREKI